jgi:hypothetical protein
MVKKIVYIGSFCDINYEMHRQYLKRREIQLTSNIHLFE